MENLPTLPQFGQGRSIARWQGESQGGLYLQPFRKTKPQARVHPKLGGMGKRRPGSGKGMSPIMSCLSCMDAGLELLMAAKSGRRVPGFSEPGA